MSHNIMSMEAALDEERKEVLALLEGTSTGSRAQRGSTGSTGSVPPAGRASSPFASPRSPVRSMLDIAEESVPRHNSIATANGGITAGTRPVRSMLDVGGPLPAPAPAPVRSMLDIGPAKTTQGAQASPIEASQWKRSSLKSAVHVRSQSDAAQRPSNLGPRATVEKQSRGDPVSSYQFSNIFSSTSAASSAPKRNTLAGKKATPAPDAGKGADRDRGRHLSIAGTGIGAGASRHSMSPSNRLGLRSNSPHANLLSPPGPPISSKYTLDDGTPVDIANAFRRLSDANLAKSGTSLAVLSHRRRTDSGEAAPDGSLRLIKDYDDENVVETSDEDHDHSSDEELHRGRRKDERSDSGSKTVGMGRASGPREAKSLMAAADEEREAIAELQARKYKVRSLLDPEITVTGPGGVRKKPMVHPSTAFDHGGGSGLSTPMDSDTEADITDIRRAQKLTVVMTPTSSTPETGRCVRTIYRGDFAAMQKEAADNHRRVRKYLVATDLSDEAQHALEWTVGTVLRDGDTLLAIYCVDEETGIPHAADSVPASQSAQAAAAAAAVDTLQAPPTSAHGHRPSLLGPGTGVASNTASPMGRHHTPAEQERLRAVEDITARVTKLLRKTRLQVRVVVEVIHCKSPKHLITEVIDYLSPTLVILGSRGRSALKGVILGSFSNYLVTKSSVPVMVARKKLRKHTKYKRPAVKLANNLAPSGKGLSLARVDEFYG